jgi:hypothetical protein
MQTKPAELMQTKPAELMQTKPAELSLLMMSERAYGLLPQTIVAAEQNRCL